MFDPKKTYDISVWDNGSIKLFDMPNYDYSYICDAINIDDLYERNEEAV